MEKKIILFLDILGFKKFVCNNEEKGIEQINEVLKIINSEFSENRIEKILPGIKKKATFFSDSVVISFENESKNEYFAVLIEEVARQVINCQIKLFEHDVLIRGGLTFGNIVHTNDKCFGTGLIGAYILESKFAVYPRVLVNEDIIAILKEEYNINCETDQKYFISKDDTDLYFIDYAKQINNRQNAKNNFEGFESMNILRKTDKKKELSKKEIIEKLDLLIKKYKKEKEVKIKYIWLKNQFEK